MNENCKIKFGLAVKNARKRSFLTQEMMAEILDISATHVKTIESGQKSPSFELLEKIVTLLNISLDAVFFDDFPKENTLMLEIKNMVQQCDGTQLELIRNLLNGITIKNNPSK